MKRKKKRVLDWALFRDLDPWFLILAVHNPDLPKQLDKHLHAWATHPFFLLPKVWRVARQYVALKTPEACRFSGWTGQGQPLNMNGGLWPPGSLHTKFIHSHLPNPSMSKTPCKWHHCWSPVVYQALYTLVFLQPGKVGLLLFYRRESLTGGQSGLQNLGCPLPCPGQSLQTWVGKGMPGCGPLRNLCFIFSGLFCEIGDIFVILAGVAILLSVPQREREVISISNLCKVMPFMREDSPYRRAHACGYR